MTAAGTDGGAVSAGATSAVNAPPPILVDTELAVVFLKRTGVTEESARNTIYHWSSSGRITNHGGTGRGQALWDLRELQARVFQWGV